MMVCRMPQSSGMPTNDQLSISFSDFFIGLTEVLLVYGFDEEIAD